MKERKTKSPIADLLRRTIAQSDVPLLVLQRETGVTRDSIRRFVNGEQFLRLDMADALAAYFGLELTKRKAK
jgi:plasmid maintenance system antidote protein VapI